MLDGAEVGPVAYGPGVRCEAAVFDGVQSHIRVDGFIGVLQGFSAWVKPAAPITSVAGGGGLFGRSVSAPAAPYLHLGSLTGQVAGELVSILMPFQPQNDSIFYWTGADVGEDIDARWNHLALSWEPDAANYRLYVNGQDRGLARMHNMPRAISLDGVTIGGYGGSPSTFLAGSIDEVRFYERPLSGSEIAVEANLSDIVVAGGCD
ncbi:hypothetical protein ABI59_14565 [Acidobacteria bacterium Mor1]|nr:hypothetical protein ABI59_14565 [Acidobacteria bacterium Mor1]